MLVMYTDNTAVDTENPEVARSHAKHSGEASMVPKAIQEVLPESVEMAVPDFIHDAGRK
jgi:hypothetical protein